METDRHHRSTATDIAPSGVRIDVDGVSRRIHVRNRGALTLLDSVSLTLSPGELVAIVGPSGAGKTTLLEAIAGITPATSGSVRFDGIDLYANLKTFRSVLGYIPQDDIIHAELPLRRTLHYAARLRLPSSTKPAEIDDAVREAIDAVGLTDHADVRVGSLSGGQRKRASIAVELLTDPHVFFLDEPTSGLDPIASAELIARLRGLADRSATIVFTTHSVEDLTHCDRVVFMSRGGRVGFVGTVTEALQTFGVNSVPALYRRLTDLADTDRTTNVAANVAANVAVEVVTPDVRPDHVIRRPVASGLTQWATLTRRTLETFVRNRLTLAILVGSPALVIGMFAILFRPGAFDFHDPSPSSMVMIGFWVVFARLLLRAHLWLAADLHGAIDPSPRTPGRSETRCVRGVEGDHPCAIPPPRRCAHARRAPPVGPAAGQVDVHVRVDRIRAAALRTRSSRPRPAHLGHGRNRGAGDTGPADAVLPGRALLGSHPAGEPDGERGCRLERDHPLALGLRGDRSRPRSTANP
ncbi:MAG: Protein white, partial [Ilumatobacteraceae bacterium]|nr:Protein white [Ilumatobacteraceae bacterium]